MTNEDNAPPNLGSPASSPERVKYPHTTTLNGEPRPIAIREVCTLGGFPVTICMPSAMSEEDLHDFEEWLQLVVRKARRWSAAYDDRSAHPYPTP